MPGKFQSFHLDIEFFSKKSTPVLSVFIRVYPCTINFQYTGFVECRWQARNPRKETHPYCLSAHGNLVL